MADALQELRDRVTARKALEAGGAATPPVTAAQPPVEPEPQLGPVAVVEPQSLSNSDNLESQYIEHRSTLEGETALMALRNRVRARTVPKTAKPVDAVKPEENKLKPSTTAAAEIDKRQLLFPASGVAEDVIAGAPEVPGAVWRGVAGGVSEMAKTADSFGNWLNENVADLTVAYDNKGNYFFGKEATEFLKNHDVKNSNPTAIVADNAAAARDLIPERQTTTGNFVEGAAQFLVSRGVAGKATKALGIPATKWTGFINDAMAGAIGFDPKEQRLSNVIDEKLGSNVVTDFLKADPEDGEAVGRFKSALENGGLGAAADGVLRAFGVVRAKLRDGAAAKNADAAAAKVADPMAETRAKYGTLKPDAFSVLGDPSKPLVEMKPKPTVRLPENMAGKLSPQEVADTSANARPKSEVYINFARINTPDDVKAVIGQMADTFKGEIDTARRGVQNNEATKELADSLGMSVEDVLSRRKGQGFNAEEALAARKLWASSGETLIEAAKKAADPNAGPADQVAFRKAMSIHYAIQAEVIGARTETARALQAWSIPAGSGEAQARQIQLLLDNAGGAGMSQELAKRVAMLDAAGVSPETLNAVVRKGWGSTSMDAIKEVWINGLLSNPKTHVVNMTSNLSVAFQQIYERAGAAKISRLRGQGDGVAEGEATVMAYAAVSGLKDAFRLAYKSIKTGETGGALGKTELARSGAISSEAFKIGGETGLGKAVDFIGAAFRVPGRALGASDEFFKSIGYRMELHAQALRQATHEGNKGRALAERMQDLIDNPPEHIKIGAADAALYSTFTNQLGDFGKGVSRIKNIDSPINLSFVVLPFLKTPMNIAKYSFERSPVAPLMAQWRADVAAGGARKDVALARMATGTAITAIAGDFAASGVISGAGPKEPGKREALMRQGWQPYSIKVGDRWYSYNRMDPFGMTMGAAADFQEFMSRGEMDPEEADEAQEIMAGILTVVSSATVSKTYLRGVADFMEMMSDPSRYSEAYIRNFVASFIPSILGVGEGIGDPIQREANSPMEAIIAKLPGLSERLTPKRDLWGEVKTNESGFGVGYDIVAPIATKGVKESTIDAELVRLGAGVERIGKKTNFDGVAVNLKNWPEVYDEYVKLAGNELKHPAFGLGAKDYLDAVVSGNHPISNAYRVMSDGDDGRKANFIKSTVSDFRELAQRQILQDPRFADFAAMIQEKKTATQRKRMPVLQ